MKDVAKAAGVSLATVSKVMNGNDSVDAQLAARVREAARSLGYRPNYIAKLLKTNRTNHVAVILPNMADENFRNIFSGAERVLYDNGYVVSLHLTSDLRSKENMFLDAALHQCAAGVVLATCQPEDGARVKALEEAGTKIVFLEREPRYGRFSYLDYDNRKTLGGATRALLAEDRRRLVLLAGPASYSSEALAVRGFQDALTEAARERPETRGDIVEANLDLESSFAALAAYLDKNAVPDAIITTSMPAYQSARKAVEILGLRPSPPLKFVTLGHAGWADSVPSDTTVISRNSHRMGEEAALALMAEIKDPIANAGRYRCIEGDAPGAAAASLLIGKVARRGRRLRALLRFSAIGSVKPLLSDFENLTGIGVDLDTFDYDDMFGIIYDSSRRERYDILQVDQPLIAELADDGLLARLDDLLGRLPESPLFMGEGNAAVLDAYSRRRGGVYAIPFRFGAQLMFYRSDLFDQPDIRALYRSLTRGELRPPQTWLEFNVVAKFFTREFNPQSPVAYGASLGGRHYIGAVSEFIPRLWSFGGTALDGRGEVALDSRQATDALANYLESFRYASPESRVNWVEGQVKEFVAGRSAMMIIFSATVGNMVYQNESRMVGRIGYAPIPGDTPLLGGWSLGVRAGCPDPEAALAWIRWITSDRMAVPNTILGGANMAAMLRKNSELRSLYPWLSMALESFRASRPHEVSAATTGGRIGYRRFVETLGDSLLLAIEGKRSPEQALAEAARRLRRLED